MVTLVAYLVSDTASSRAELPPPTTTISFPVKKSPSQVAQYDIPLPLKVSSPFYAEGTRPASGGKDNGIGREGSRQWW